MQPHLGIWKGWDGDASFRVGALPAPFQAVASPASSPGPAGACCSIWQPRAPNIWLDGTGLG